MVSEPYISFGLPWFHRFEQVPRRADKEAGVGTPTKVTSGAEATSSPCRP